MGISKNSRKTEHSIDRHNPQPILIPSCIFNTELSSFETIAKFLKENHNLNFEQIAKLLRKKKQSTWRAYKNALTKFPESLPITNFYYLIPIEIFAESKLSLLEQLVVFLKEKSQLNYSQISALLMRDDRTIWTVYQRATKKRSGRGRARKDRTRKNNAP